MSARVVDLRSDTVTRPDADMREAMASAEVGDDVFGEDPTVNRLEDEAARVAGHQAALFVPSGTMANEIALNVHAAPGTEVICEAESHVFHYELGGMARLSGLMPRPIAGRRGLLAASQVERAIAPNAIYRARTGVTTLENTAMSAGGLAGRPQPQREVVELCHRSSVPVHLDGGRVFNAAAALDLPVAALTGFFDSAMFSLSKGLGAPAGSMLCASAEFIAEARRVRKLFGGGMRQVGILAAAGLMALERGARSLLPDHANARRLAEGLAQVPGLTVDPDRIETNILVVQVENDGAEQLVEKIGRRGVLAVTLDPARVRFVTHRDVDAQAIERAIEIVGKETSD